MSNRYALDEIQWPDVPFDLKAATIMAMRRGSEAHGTYVPPDSPDSIDDRDVMGVCVAPRSYYLGIDHWDSAESIKGPWDVVLYDYRRFVRLLMKQNPNVLSMLYLAPEDYLHLSVEGQALIENRGLFRHLDLAFQSFLGYANGQMKRMTHIATASTKGTPRYATGYLGAKRKALVEKYGYDTKNAAHLVRLLVQAIEFHSTGTITVKLTGSMRETVVSIKKGAWTLDEVGELSNDLTEDARKAYERSVLPKDFDRDAINRLTVILGGGNFVRSRT